MEQDQHIETWFRMYHKEIHNYLTYYTGSQDVEDLVQEVFIKAIKSKSHYRGDASVKTWLFRIARNCAIDELRRRRFRTWVPDELLTFFRSDEKGPPEALELREDIRHLYAAILSLRKSYRDVIFLRHLQGLSVKETSEVLDWSESKVNVTIHRALKQLRAKMGNDRGVMEIETFVR